MKKKSKDSRRLGRHSKNKKNRMSILTQILSAKALDNIDLFDRVQLARVIQVCRDSRSMSEAGRQLFDASRTRKTSTNDADRLRKYLARFGIEWDQIAKA